MRYYTVKIVIATDGTETRDLRGFDSMDDALVKFHSDLTSNISKVTKISEMLIGGDLTNYKKETWIADATDTDSETTE